MTTESLPPEKSSAGRSSSAAISRMTRIDSASRASSWPRRRVDASGAVGRSTAADAADALVSVVRVVSVTAMASVREGIVSVVVMCAVRTRSW